MNVAQTANNFVHNPGAQGAAQLFNLAQSASAMFGAPNAGGGGGGGAGYSGPGYKYNAPAYQGSGFQGGGGNPNESAQQWV